MAFTKDSLVLRNDRYVKPFGRKLLTLVQLQTVIKEVEAVVNTRPLVYVGDDINSNITLSPTHFLTLNPRVTTPEVDKDDVDEDYTPVRSSADLLLKCVTKVKYCCPISGEYGVRIIFSIYEREPKQR